MVEFRVQNTQLMSHSAKACPWSNWQLTQMEGMSVMSLWLQILLLTINQLVPTRNMRVQIKACQHHDIYMYDYNSEWYFSWYIEIWPHNYCELLLNISFETFTGTRV